MIFDMGRSPLQVSKLLRGNSLEESSEVLGKCMLGKRSQKENELWSHTDFITLPKSQLLSETQFPYL